MTALRDENVCRLDVPVDDARSMGGIKRVRDVNSQRQDGLDFQRPAADAVLERQPFEILHRDEGLIALPADFVKWCRCSDG